MTTLKKCKRCAEEKDFALFATGKNKDGLSSYCKVCHRAISKEIYAKNKGKRIKEVRNWQQRNVEKVRDYVKKFRAKGVLG